LPTPIEFDEENNVYENGVRDLNFSLKGIGGFSKNEMKGGNDLFKITINAIWGFVVN